MTLTWSWHWQKLDVALGVGVDTATIFQSSRQRWYQYERGGQLFVDVSDPTGLKLIATPPHPSDQAGHTWLEIDDARCRAEIEIANAEGLRLIGYWHTHPQRIPQLSAKDMASFKAYSIRYQRDLPQPLAVIVGTVKQPRGVRAWLIRSEEVLEGEQCISQIECVN